MYIENKKVDRVMSSMTLALLQDSGWYFVDFSKAEVNKMKMKFKVLFFHLNFFKK